MFKFYHLLYAGLLCAHYTASAEQTTFVSLSQNSHVCNAESEIARLAENEQLQEMARALVEFKATKYCFILPDATNVTVLERQAGYIKFDYKSQVLFTFSKYVIATTIAANNN